ncbi:MAG: AbgT family transporter [Bacilli bacterium]|nr:AbgT family transporter [Bacilli bacterium]MDD4607589.1 AbgT family transporter [Bacilli bacterium]
MIKRKKEKHNIMLGPVITLILLTIIVIVASTIFSLLGIEGQKTQIVNDALQTSLTTVNNILTKDGLKYVISSTLTNFKLFEPLVLLIISLIALGIGEASGLFKAVFSPLKKARLSLLLFCTLFLGIISTFIGEYSYVLLLPLTGIVYKYADKKPMLGIITVFLGITLGFGAGIIPSYNDYLLGLLTEKAAVINVDKDYQFNLFSNIYIMITSTVILTVLGTMIIKRYLVPKISKTEIIEDELVVSKKALYYSNLAFGIILIGVIYMILPSSYSSGLLLGEGENYIVRLWSDGAPFKDGFMYIIVLIMMICGFIYGYVSKNIKNSTEYSVGLSKNFEGIGYLFVLLFFTSQLVGLLEYTNLGEVIAVRLVDFMGTLQFSGIPLIITMFIVIILMSILIPSTIIKWTLASPILVPLFMRSNITPDFTQFIFKVSDGVGRSITPLFIYFIVMLAFLQKYNTNEENKITIFGTLKMMMPSILLLGGLWLLIVIGWYVIGLPLGIGGYPTL